MNADSELDKDGKLLIQHNSELSTRVTSWRPKILFIFTLLSFLQTLGNAENTDCPAGYACLNEENTECEQGWYSQEGELECNRCPEGKLSILDLLPDFLNRLFLPHQH